MRATGNEPAGEARTIVLATRHLTLAMGAGVLLLSLAGLGALVSVHLLPDFPGRDTFTDLFMLNRELNVPTWYSSTLLVVAAALLALIAGLTRLERAPSFSAWAGLALIFLYLSADEVASIHERYFGKLSPLPEQGVFFYGWVVPAMVFVLILTVSYGRFVFRLPAPVRRLAVAAAALYVGGSLGLELVEAVLDEQGPRATLLFGGIAGLEEILEMAGVLIFIVALLRYVSIRHPTARLALDDKETNAPHGIAPGSRQ